MKDKTQKKKCVIWGDINLNPDDWKDDLLSEDPGLSESELYERMYYTNATYLDDARENLDIQLNQPIIAIADIGTWNGRFKGYKMIQSGNIRDCLSTECDSAEWCVDGLGDLRCTAIHHDGVNYICYRVFKDGISDKQIENLQDKIYHGTVTRADITRVTKRLGDEIARVYGFELTKRKMA